MATTTNKMALLSAAVAFLSAALLLLSPSAEASCALGPHADGAGRASAADPATYSDVCVGKLRDQESAEVCKLGDSHCTGRPDMISHRKWREPKQQLI